MSWPSTPWGMAIDAIHTGLCETSPAPNEEDSRDLLHTVLSIAGLHLSSETISRADALAEFERYLDDFGTDERPDRRFLIGMMPVEGPP